MVVAHSQYQDYRRRLDARAVLNHYGIENEREEVTHAGETEVIHSCLLDRVEPHHNNSDQNPSASCNLDRKLYICYAHWGGSLFHLIQKMENKTSFDEILPVVSGMLSGATLPENDWLKEVAGLQAMLQDRSYSVELPSYSDRVLRPWAFVHPYLHERGIDSQTASRLQIGWREEDNRIIIPHFWQGSLVGWQARSVPDRPGQWPGTANPNPKYCSTTGFPKSDTFYYDHSRPFPQSGDVVVVESPMSVIKATALGLQIPVLATFGAKVSRTQIGMLSDYDRVYLWPDPDSAGQIMQNSLTSRMVEVGGLVSHPGLCVVSPDEGMDLADYQSLKEVEDKLEDSLPAVLLSSRREEPKTWAAKERR